MSSFADPLAGVGSDDLEELNDSGYGTDTTDPSALYDSSILPSAPVSGVISFPQTTVGTTGLSTAQTSALSGLSPASILASISSFALTGAVLAKLPSSATGATPQGGVSAAQAQAIASATLAQQNAAGAKNSKYLMYGVIVLAIIIIGYFLVDKG